MHTMKLLTMAEVLAEIPLLASDAATIQSRIHVAACSTLDHIRDCGDTRGAVALLNALPKGQRVKALGAWYRHFSGGKVVPTVDKSTGAWTITLGKNRKDEDFNIDGAVEMSFADLTNERDPVSVTVESLIRNLVRTANNTEQHEGTSIDKVSPEAREVAAKVVAFLTEQGIRKVA